MRRTLKVVSNTTPIISLLKISRLDILQSLYQVILIPKAVYDEIESGKNKEYYRDLSTIDWIKTIEISNRNILSQFKDLDAGEAEAIALAKETDADLLLIDEKLGRYHAKNSHLKITGTVGVLLRAKAEGRINLIEPLLLELKEKEVWFSQKLVREILFIADELKE